MGWDAAAIWGYVLILGAFLFWEAMGLRRSDDRWPPLTHIVRYLMRLPGWQGIVVKLGLAVLLTWLPLHFFFEV